MTVKNRIISSALLVGVAFTAAVATSSATLARTYHQHHRGLYNSYGSHSKPDVNRGGPGPRVGAGSGMGIGADR